MFNNLILTRTNPPLFRQLLGGPVRAGKPSSHFPRRSPLKVSEELEETADVVMDKILNGLALPQDIDKTLQEFIKRLGEDLYVILYLPFPLLHEEVDQDPPYIFYYAVIKILVAKKSSIYDPSSSSDDGRREAVREFLKDFLRVLNDLGNRDPLVVLKTLLDFVIRYKSYSLPDSAPVPPVTL